MNKKLPFEDELEDKLQQLPTPGEDAAWHAMSKLLDENKKRFVPPPVKKYLVLFLLASLLCGGIWIVLTHDENNIPPQKQANSSMVTLKEATTDSVKNTNVASPSNQPVNDKRNIKESDAATIPSSLETVGSHTTIITASEQTEIPPNPLAIAQQNKRAPFNNHKNIIGKQDDFLINALISGPANETHPGDRIDRSDVKHLTRLNKKGKAVMKIQGDAQIAEQAENGNADSPEIQQNNVTDNAQKSIAENHASIKPNAVDQAVRPIIASNSPKDSASNAITKQSSQLKTSKKENNKQRFLWSTGIGLQQQIPLGKQQLVAYGFNGKKSFIDDYIPSIYLQLEQDKKWFIQAAFSYGSPVAVAPFAYSRNTMLNNTSTKMSTVILELKKTYYHKIPVSFNYYLKPHWSMGAGVLYSLLHKTITEQQTITKNLQTQQEEITAHITSAGFRDSFFYKSQTSWMLQTNYEWRRFSFGMRYSHNLQPYIKYTTPAGDVTQQKNWSLDCLLRYRIWQTSKKN